MTHKKHPLLRDCDKMRHMCGRFERSSSIEIIIRDFRINKTSVEITPSYNIAPSQNVLIIRLDEEEKRQLESCRWGFLPSWAKDPALAHKMINARTETVATKPAFRSAFKRQRCLVVADGFYEWQKKEHGKVPFYIHLKSGRPFAFAGLYSHWTPEEGAESICTCTVITTEANELLEPIHNRMPVIIPRDKEDLWLNPDEQDQDVLLGLLKPYPSEEMEMHEVSAKVNYPKYNSPDAIKPVSREP
jgi:putative SOS response-associated peptidase YedK